MSAGINIQKNTESTFKSTLSVFFSNSVPLNSFYSESLHAGIYR